MRLKTRVFKEEKEWRHMTAKDTPNGMAVVREEKWSLMGILRRASRRMVRPKWPR